MKIRKKDFNVKLKKTATHWDKELIIEGSKSIEEKIDEMIRSTAKFGDEEPKKITVSGKPQKRIEAKKACVFFVNTVVGGNIEVGNKSYKSSKGHIVVIDNPEADIVIRSTPNTSRKAIVYYT